MTFLLLKRIFSVIALIIALIILALAVVYSYWLIGMLGGSFLIAAIIVAVLFVFIVKKTLLRKV